MTTTARILLWVALGSAIGGVARALVGSWVEGALQVPSRTLLINVTGSFLLGFFMHWAGQQPAGHPNLRAFVAVGLCGGYTTFSTFSFDTVVLLETGAYARAAMYVALSVLGSVGAVLLGFVSAKALS